MPDSSATVEVQQGMKPGVQKAAVEKVNKEEETGCRVGVPPCLAHRTGLTEIRTDGAGHGRWHSATGG
jgi:hypothetical protein